VRIGGWPLRHEGARASGRDRDVDDRRGSRGIVDTTPTSADDPLAVVGVLVGDIETGLRLRIDPDQDPYFADAALGGLDDADLTGADGEPLKPSDLSAGMHVQVRTGGCDESYRCNARSSRSRWSGARGSGSGWPPGAGASARPAASGGPSRLGRHRSESSPRGVSGSAPWPLGPSRTI